MQSAVTRGYLAAGALSPDGRCKFGDASANGYVRSEGAGVVILKPLANALADGDRVHAVIRGSAVTHSGQTGDSLLAPGEQGQIRLLRQALAAAEVSSADLAYIEAHGTGTKVGDRMELRALGAVLNESPAMASHPCLVGSVKTNIGHTESAAGVAGLIKAILCLKHRQIPPSLHFRQPNPEIPWDQIPLKIATELTPLNPRGNAALAGINSFGITGTFAHVIVQESPDSESCDSQAQPSQLPARGTPSCKAPEKRQSAVILPIAARSEPALRQLADAFARKIRANPGQLSDLACSAARRRTHHEIRLAAGGSQPDAIAQSLEHFAAGRASPSVAFDQDRAENAPCVGFVFSGQGPQWAGMGMRLLAAEPVFRAVLEDLEPRIEAETGWSLLDELGAPPAASRLNVTAVAQPAIFAIQVALAALLKSWGVQPAMLVGHSVGEAAAAYTAGVLSLEDAVHVICHRARVLEAASGLGRMAAVELTEDEARELLSRFGGRLSIAAMNGPRSLTISGATEPLRELCAIVDERGRFSRELDVNYPFHSALLDPLLSEMEAAAQHVRPQAAAIPIYSTVRGELASAGDYGR
ncbi:MAG TPA: type I polyketide synthase, partial [Pirellulales bacterium]|nr:type I polyketide synthase [Pirellulales bacterium]